MVSLGVAVSTLYNFYTLDVSILESWLEKMNLIRIRLILSGRPKLLEKSNFGKTYTREIGLCRWSSIKPLVLSSCFFFGGAVTFQRRHTLPQWVVNSSRFLTIVASTCQVSSEVRRAWPFYRPHSKISGFETTETGTTYCAESPRLMN
jgi:hypothetical protein